MAKIDNRLTILPDIEMYGGNTDLWEVQLIKADGSRYTYAELTGLNYDVQLIITDYGYMYRPGGQPATTVAIQGELGTDDDMASAVARFKFAYGDTAALHGKYTYQISFSIPGGANSTYVSAQGTLMVRSHIASPV